MCEDVFSAYYLERYVLGEISEEIAEKIRSKAATDPGLRAELAAIEASNEDVLALYPPGVFKREVAAALAAAGETPAQRTLSLFGRRGRRPSLFFLKRPLLIFSGTAALLVIFLFLILPSLNEQSLLNTSGHKAQSIPAEDTLVKGEGPVDTGKTQLLVYRKSGDAAEMLDEAERVTPGDLLQLAYVSAGERYGIILSIDGRGVVSLHFPEAMDASTHMEINREIFLPNAIELDDAPDFERFFLITSPGPLDVSVVMESAGGLAEGGNSMEGSLDLPEGINQISFLVLKGDVR